MESLLPYISELCFVFNHAWIGWGVCWASALAGVPWVTGTATMVVNKTDLQATKHSASILETR